MPAKKTIVGNIDPEILTFTVGKDTVLDLALAEADCLGTAAHVTMLSTLETTPKIFKASEKKKIIKALVSIIEEVRLGVFKIASADQDIHLAIEAALTRELGDIGKKVHTARSRNDQVAVDLRLYGKEQLLQAMNEVVILAGELLRFAFKNTSVPMVGRTHCQPAMPSSVGLWASAHAESLLDDMIILRGAYDFNDKCPLGSAAGYGVSLNIDRKMTSKLLAFKSPIHNVLYASSSRGKCESVILSAMSGVMITLSRLAEDLMMYSLPEMGYFVLPQEYCTGSSIMPQKNNPDVFELIRARSSSVLGWSSMVAGIVNALPSGYNRDLQETKEPFIEGVHTTRSCLRVMASAIKKIKVDEKALIAAFKPEVFAADRALELAVGGMTFRDAYDAVKKDLKQLKKKDPKRVIEEKIHLGAPGGLDFDELAARATEGKRFFTKESRRFHNAISKLLSVKYPEL